MTMSRRGARKAGLTGMVIAALLWALIYAFSGLDFYVMVIVTVFLMSFMLLLTRKPFTPAGVVIIGGALAAGMRIAAGQLTNYSIVLLFIILGVLFSALGAIAGGKLEMKAWMVILIAAVSAAVLPWVLGLMVKADISAGIKTLINSTLSYLLAGLAGGAAAYCIWYCMREKRFILGLLHKR